MGEAQMIGDPMCGFEGLCLFSGELKIDKYHGVDNGLCRYNG